MNFSKIFSIFLLTTYCSLIGSPNQSSYKSCNSTFSNQIQRAEGDEIILDESNHNGTVFEQDNYYYISKSISSNGDASYETLTINLLANSNITDKNNFIVADNEVDGVSILDWDNLVYSEINHSISVNILSDGVVKIAAINHDTNIIDSTTITISKVYFELSSLDQTVYFNENENAVFSFGISKGVNIDNATWKRNEEISPFNALDDDYELTISDDTFSIELVTNKNGIVYFDFEIFSDDKLVYKDTVKFSAYLPNVELLINNIATSGTYIMKNNMLKVTATYNNDYLNEDLSWDLVRLKGNTQLRIINSGLDEKNRPFVELYGDDTLNKDTTYALKAQITYNGKIVYTTETISLVGEDEASSNIIEISKEFKMEFHPKMNFGTDGSYFLELNKKISGNDIFFITIDSKTAEQFVNDTSLDNPQINVTISNSGRLLGRISVLVSASIGGEVVNYRMFIIQLSFKSALPEGASMTTEEYTQIYLSYFLNYSKKNNLDILKTMYGYNDQEEVFSEVRAEYLLLPRSSQVRLIENEIFAKAYIRFITEGIGEGPYYESFIPEIEISLSNDRYIAPIVIVSTVVFLAIFGSGTMVIVIVKRSRKDG